MLKAPIEAARRRRTAEAVPPSSIVSPLAPDQASFKADAPPTKRARAKFLLGRISDEPEEKRQSSFTPGAFPSCAWWSCPLRDSTADLWDSLLDRLVRPLHVVEGCAGVAPAHIAAKALAIPVQSGISSDLKKHAREVQIANIPELEHVYESMGDQIAKSGHNFKYGCQTTTQNIDADILCVGPPCQPYSGYRANQKTIPPEKHPLYHTTFGIEGTGDADCRDGAGNVLDLIQSSAPHVLIFEQVIKFGKTDITGKCHLDKFVEKLTQMARPDGTPMFSKLHLFAMDAATWLDISRQRTVKKKH